MRSLILLVLVLSIQLLIVNSSSSSSSSSRSGKSKKSHHDVGKSHKDHGHKDHDHGHKDHDHGHAHSDHDQKHKSHGPHKPHKPHGPHKSHADHRDHKGSSHQVRPQPPPVPSLPPSPSPPYQPQPSQPPQPPQQPPQPPSSSPQMPKPAPPLTSTGQPYVKRIVFPNNEIIYFAYFGTQYLSLPSTLNMNIGSTAQTFTLSGTPTNLILIGPNNQKYPITITLNKGMLQFWIFMNGQTVQLPFQGGAPLPPNAGQSGNNQQSPQPSQSALANVQFINPNTLEDQIHQYPLPNGQTAYGCLQNGQWRLLPSSLSISSASGGSIPYTLSGTAPNLKLVGPNNQVLIVRFAMVNGQLVFIVNIGGQNVQIQLGGGPPVPSELLNTPPKIDFINQSDVKHPIIKITYYNGMTVYYAYFNGQYRELPSALQLTVNGVSSSYQLKGNPPNLYLLGAKGKKFPLMPAMEDGQVVYYSKLKDIDIKLPFGEILQQSAGIVFVDGSQVAHPIKVINNNGQWVYYQYINGQYEPLSSTFQLVLNGQPLTFSFTGGPGKVQLHCSNGQNYELEYSTQNGHTVYYININGCLYQIPCGSITGPPVPPSSSTPPSPPSPPWTAPSPPSPPSMPSTSMPPTPPSPPVMPPSPPYMPPTPPSPPVMPPSPPSHPSTSMPPSPPVMPPNPPYTSMPSNPPMPPMPPTSTPTNLPSTSMPPQPPSHPLNSGQPSNSMRPPSPPLTSGPGMQSSPMASTPSVNSGNLPPIGSTSYSTLPPGLSTSSNSVVVSSLSSNDLPPCETPSSGILDNPCKLNGQQLVCWNDGNYVPLPSTFTPKGNGCPSSCKLDGSLSSIYYLCSDGTKHALKWTFQNGHLGYWLNFNGQHITVPFNLVPSWIQPGNLKFPIKLFKLKNGQLKYFAFIDGKYRPVPTEMNVPVNGGAHMKFTFTGSSPNIRLRGANGVYYPIYYGLVNGQQVYYVFYNGHYWPLPLRYVPQFVNWNKLQYPIKLEQMSGVPTYLAYTNGKYTPIKAPISIDINGNSIDFGISGNPPNVGLTLNNIFYPFYYSNHNGHTVYYIFYDGHYVRVPIGFIFKFADISGLQYPIQKIVGLNEQTQYIAYVNGGYQFIPSAYNLTVNGKQKYFRLVGDWPRFEIESKIGTHYPISFSWYDGRLKYYVDLGTQYVSIPMKLGYPFKVLNGAELPYRIRATKTGNSMTYYAYFGGKYQKIPTKFPLTVDNIHQTYTIVGTPPNLRLKSQFTGGYRIIYSFYHGDTFFYIYVNGHYQQLPLGIGRIPTNTNWSGVRNNPIYVGSSSMSALKHGINPYGIGRTIDGTSNNILYTPYAGADSNDGLGLGLGVKLGLGKHLNVGAKVGLGKHLGVRAKVGLGSKESRRKHKSNSLGLGLNLSL